MNKQLSPEELEKLKKKQAKDNNSLKKPATTTHLDHLNVSGQAPLFG